MKKQHITLTIILLIILFGLAYNPILRPSYYSTQFSCNPEKFELVAEEKGLVVQGQVTSDGENIEVTFTEFADEETIKHEWIHYKQIKRKFWIPGYCEPFGIFAFVNEMEAYTFEGLPDNIFNFIYGEPNLNFQIQ